MMDQAEFDLLFLTNKTEWFSLFLDEADIVIDELANTDPVTVRGYTMECVDFEGGYEGAGEYTHVIVSFKKDNEFVCWMKLEGYYSSWEGTDWSESAYEVVPKEVRVIQYFPV